MIDLKPACERMIDVLAGITEDQLSARTPCAEYTVRDLVDHVDGVARGSASVARKDPAYADAAPVSGDDWRDDVAKDVRMLGEAWDDPAAWEGRTNGDGLDLANELWGKIAFTEIVVHGWDLAQATGQSFDLPEETLLACLDHVSGFVPNAPVEGLWGPAVEVPADAPLLDRVVAITGRTP